MGERNGDNTENEILTPKELNRRAHILWLDSIKLRKESEELEKKGEEAMKRLEKLKIKKKQFEDYFAGNEVYVPQSYFIVAGKEQINATLRVGLLAHPSRYKIANFLYKNGEAHCSQIEKGTGIPRPNCGFHLTTLEKAELVKGFFKIIEKPVPPSTKGLAGKYYHLTPTAIAILEGLHKLHGEKNG